MNDDSVRAALGDTPRSENDGEFTAKEEAVLERARREAPVWTPDSVAPHLRETMRAALGDTPEPGEAK